MAAEPEDLVTFSQSPIVTEVRRLLATSADPQRARTMQAYMKSAMPFRGVSAVPLRKLCRRVFDAHRIDNEDAWRSVVLDLWDGAAYREERYAAIELTGHRYYRAFQHPGTLDLYRHLVVTGAWWDLVDGVAGNRVGPILRGSPGVVGAIMRSWSVDADLWVRRAAILCQLGSKASTDTGLLTFVLEQNLEPSLHGREFFVRKAVGWALREYAKTDPAWVLRFVAEHEHSLSGLSRREALKNVPPEARTT